MSIPGVMTTSPMRIGDEYQAGRGEYQAGIGVNNRLEGVSTKLLWVITRAGRVNTRLVGGEYQPRQKLFPKGVRGSITELCCLKSQHNND
jgi:hypothetical protein